MVGEVPAVREVVVVVYLLGTRPPHVPHHTCCQGAADISDEVYPQIAHIPVLHHCYIAADVTGFRIPLPTSPTLKAHAVVMKPMAIPK